MSMRRENNQARHHKTSAGFQELLSSSSDVLLEIDGRLSFCNNWNQYEWTYVNEQELLVPYRSDGTNSTRRSLTKTEIRWESRRVWIVEGALCRGESNVLARRRFYLDRGLRQIIFGEGFDGSENLQKWYMLSRDPFTAAVEGCWYELCSW